ncbi:hypothetical protein [Gemmata sp.]|uniref:hypothetical protein n=1 Tax=Gemmata sp. TaxID=1914242 RepID=UPI003F73054A
MSGYPDGGYDSPRPPSAQELAAARSAVAAPAVFLILNAVLGLAITAALSVPMVFQPDMIPRVVRDLLAQQPPSPQKAEQEKQIEELENAINANREAYVRQNAIQLAVPAALNVFVFAGAVLMRGLSAYTVCVIAAVVAIVPGFSGCLCTNMPFGIWALVVLVRPDVKAAFAARRLPPADPDAQYLR